MWYVKYCYGKHIAIRGVLSCATRLKVSASGLLKTASSLHMNEAQTAPLAQRKQDLLFPMDVGVFPRNKTTKKKRLPLLQQQHSVLERQEEISRREIRSLSPAGSTGAAGAFITKLIAFAATEGRNWGEISQKASQTQAKLSTVESRE